MIEKVFSIQLDNPFSIHIKELSFNFLPSLMEPFSIILFIILFLLSAFFSSSETAFMSVPSHKVETFLKQKKFGAKDLKKLKSNTDRLLITILIGNNLVNTFTASFATSIAMDIAKNL